MKTEYREKEVNKEENVIYKVKFIYKSKAEKVKRRRAKGECLGTRSLRRTWKAAKSCGEAQTAIDPQISEWGNPAEKSSVIIM